MAERPFTIMANLLHAQETLTGTGYYSLYLIEEMLRLPERPRVIGVTSPINTEAFRIARAPDYVRLRWGSDHPNVMARRMVEWGYLGGLIRQESPDVFWGPSNFLPWRKQGPMAVTIHDMTFFEHPEALPPVRRRYWHAWTHRTIAVADAILTVSEDAKRAIIRHGNANPESITVVPNGTGRAFFVGRDEDGRAQRRRALRERFPQLPQSYVLFLGTLTAHKNVPRLVEAIARARDSSCPDIRLVLAGKRGNEYDAIARAILQNRISDRVIELGYVEDAILPALYENARVFVLPSFTEGFGMPITEAMACGTPVVTSNRGATAEVGGHAALLVDPYDATDMGEAVARLWRDESAYREARGRGLERARLFTWENAARKTFEVLRSVSRQAHRAR